MQSNAVLQCLLYLPTHLCKYVDVRRFISTIFHHVLYLRWLAPISSTFHFPTCFNRSLPPKFIIYYHYSIIKEIPNHWWKGCETFLDYHSNNSTQLIFYCREIISIRKYVFRTSPHICYRLCRSGKSDTSPGVVCNFPLFWGRGGGWDEEVNSSF